MIASGRRLANLIRLERLYNNFSISSSQDRPRKVIVTHNGVFHADESMACALLSRFTPGFKDAEIRRSRDSKVIESADVVVDVGGVYDPQANRFDHHQRGFASYFSQKYDIKLSASGLVYLHYGKECILEAAESLANKGLLPLWFDNKEVAARIESLHEAIYKSFFLTLDAIDNGVNMVDSSVPKRYEPYRTDLAHRVSRLNSPWWTTVTEQDSLERFKHAVKLCEEEFLEEVLSTLMSTIGTESLLMKALRENILHEGKILVLEEPCAWKSALHSAEKSLGITGRTLFVIFKDRFNGSYRVQAVPVEPSSFESRQLLAVEWRGLSFAKLAEVSGVPDSIFVHHSGFIGGAQSKDSAIKMAELTLDR